MLRQRIFTAVVLAAFFLLAIFVLPAPLFSAFIAMVVLISAWEWSNLSGFGSIVQRILYLVFILLLILGLALYLQVLTPAFTGFESVSKSLVSERYRNVFVFACVWWTLALLWVQSYPTSAVLWGRKALRALMGVAVLVPTWAAFTYVRHQPNGIWLVLTIIAVVAAADIGGYFVGRRFGRRKLALSVSPGKTWEGFFGGVAANVFFALLLWQLMDCSLVWAFALVLPASFASVLGDLLESMVKRERGVKDSSALLPGHGGVLDRVDGLTAAAPVFALALLASGIHPG